MERIAWGNSARGIGAARRNKKRVVISDRNPCFYLVPKRRFGTLQISAAWQYVDFI